MPGCVTPPHHVIWEEVCLSFEGDYVGQLPGGSESYSGQVPWGLAGGEGRWAPPRYPTTATLLELQNAKSMPAAVGSCCRKEQLHQRARAFTTVTVFMELT